MQTEKPESHSPKASAFPQRSFCSEYLYDRAKVILSFQIWMREFSDSGTDRNTQILYGRMVYLKVAMIAGPESSHYKGKVFFFIMI